MDIIKHIAVIIVLLGFVKATNLTEFIGLWQGVETLSSPTTSHQDRSIYLNIKTNSDDETNLVMSSNVLRTILYQNAPELGFGNRFFMFTII